MGTHPIFESDFDCLTVDQIRLVAITVSVSWMVILLLRTVTNMARSAFKLFLFMTILVYFYAFHFDLLASYIPQLRRFRMPPYFYEMMPPVKKVVRRGLIALADRIYDLAKLLR